MELSLIHISSVGAGNILNDMIHSGWFACVKLTEVFRQEMCIRDSSCVCRKSRLSAGKYSAGVHKMCGLSGDGKRFDYPGQRLGKDISGKGI